MNYVVLLDKFRLITIIIYNDKYIWFYINIIAYWLKYVLIIVWLLSKKTQIIYNVFLNNTFKIVLNNIYFLYNKIKPVILKL